MGKLPRTTQTLHGLFISCELFATDAHRRYTDSSKYALSGRWKESSGDGTWGKDRQEKKKIEIIMWLCRCYSKLFINFASE